MPLPAPIPAQPNVRVVTLKIDGLDLSAREDETIIEVCRENKIPIPSLCWMDGLSIVGRLPAVHGRDHRQPACWPPAPPVSRGHGPCRPTPRSCSATAAPGRTAVRRAQPRLLGLRLQRPLRAAMAGADDAASTMCACPTATPATRGQQPRDVPRRPQPLRALHPLRARLRRDRGRPHLGHHGPRQRVPGHHRPGQALGRQRHLHQLRQVRAGLPDRRLVKQGTSVGEMVKDQHFLPILARRRHIR
jgi:bidirectional [NiFe] hydrogenase diaphorase subunit